VDIGDDVPAKEFPPVVIEKDKVVHANVSSSSSSSSGSGSSSSGKSDYNLVLWKLFSLLLLCACWQRSACDYYCV
jgi:hypothetical protein